MDFRKCQRDGNSSKCCVAWIIVMPSKTTKNHLARSRFLVEEKSPISL